MKSIISIIVAAYNIEELIGKCIESLCEQTYRDVEILLIDDGSTDRTGEICDKYAETDQRIRCFHKENRGLSSTRNYGIEKAKGTYVTFVDGDDWVSRDYIELLYQNLTRENADLSIIGYSLIWGNGSVLKKTNEDDYLVLNTRDAIHELFVQQRVTCMSCSKLYRIELFNDISFPEGEVFEDTAIALDIFKKCKTVVYSGKSAYYYYQRDNSIVNSRFNPAKMALLRNGEKMIEYSESQGGVFNEEVHAYYLSSAMMLMMQVYGDPDVKYNREKKEIQKKIIKNKKYIFSNQYLPMRKKIILYLMISPIPFDSIIYCLWTKWMVFQGADKK